MMTSRFVRRATAVAIAALGCLESTLLWAAPHQEAGIGLPHDISTEGHRIDWLIGVTNVLTGILFIIMFGWILWAGIKHNEKNEKHQALYDHGTSRRSMMVALSMAGGVFLVVDGNLFVNSTLDLEEVYHNFDKIEANPDTIRIEINAHQWAWDARYAGPDGKFNTKDDIIGLNEVKIPVGAPVIFQVASVDVLHSFNLPHFRAKIDAVPGQINQMWVEAKETGEYEIGCAQHCGTNHYKMRGVITILPKDEYARWAAEASKIGERGYNEADATSHWGWDWKVRK